ncbi:MULTISPECIES: zincin-like metallopeptidase domain-containing protein [Pseudomonadota]|jgi:putative DNA primase/helicase|uniref:TraC n=21 Tax=Pseudomonadota TaxID=1224 RepID=G9C9G7_COMTE|nr:MULTISPECIES: zincin-like metallopeptidase domain-containing protein [Pseudomonadota]AEV57168.1 TraC [uncultured bacterium]AEV91096.1 TraC [synthetic construct]ABM06250.1 TraC2 [Comamonas testosteroni CNB-1]ADP19882.1 DNA primase TraC [Achromobacter xylosoxidans A8]AEA41930.1 TraC [Delftia acidovorans]
MPINQAEAQAVTLAFVRDYPGALELAYRFRDNTGELYGHRAAEVPADLKGGYVPKETIHNGRAYRGRVDVPLANMDDAADLVLTLRHEVLGHYGANTFKPAEKRALLDGLIAAREEPSLKPRWEDINRRYAGASMDVRAEEVWALHCESIAPGQHAGQAQVLERGQQSFMETCIARVRPMQVADLHNIVCMVADGLHDRSRTQQTFPQINELFRRDEAMEPKKPFHEVVAEKLIEQLKAGTAPWQRPWEPGEPNAYLPMNPTTGKRYKGINAIHLMAQGRSDGRWMTYKQAAAVGAQVRKGEKGTPVQYWKFSEEQNKVDESGRPVLNAKGEPVKETVQLERPRVFFATVFNAEQIDGLPPIQKKEQTWSAVERAEHILKASGASITHAPGDRAFYRPATDSIHLPDRGQFPTADNYYATALHELGHWTGHPSRLDRDLAHPFGSEGYAKEELRAEIASMIVGDELGIGHDPGQHAAYVGSWIKALQDEPLEVFRAAADAEKIHDYVLAFEQKQVQEQEQAQVQQPEQHYSDLTLQALVEKHGWEVAYSGLQEPGRVDSVHRTFEGVGPLGTMTTPNGERRLSAGYHDDAERRRYVTLKLGDQVIGDADGRDQKPEEIARQINAKAEQYADERRVKNGLEPIYSIASQQAEAQQLNDELREHGQEIVSHLDAQSRWADGERIFAFHEQDEQPHQVRSLAELESYAPDQLLALPALAQEQEAKPLSVAERTAEQHEAMKAADDAFQRELVRAYGENNAGDARYKTQHDDEAVQKAGDAFVAASNAWREAVRDARQTVASQEATMQVPQQTDQAEAWMLKHVELGTVGRALEGATLEQIDRALDVLDRMQPMNTQNEFWTRHELPYDLEPLEAKINDAIDHLVEERRPDAVVAATRLDLATGNTNSRERDRQAFHLAADDALGFPLPHDWTGEVRVVGVVERDGETRAADLATETPEAYHLYARKGEAQFGEDAFAYLTATRTLGEADELADRLALIDANSQTDEYEKATRLARVQEDRVRRDPNSTDEDISAAKEARKALEAKAFVAAEEAKNSQRVDDERGDSVEHQAPQEQRVAAADQQPAQASQATERQYISVPFKEKDEAKQLGARWDRKEQSWYVPAGVDAAPFAKWSQGAATPAVEAKPTQQAPEAQDGGQKAAQAVQQARQYLAVPYEQRNAAKAAGALWDKAAKSWYAGPRADMAKLEQWKPENVQAQQGPAMTPREEFAEAMRSAGLFTGSNAQGDHPIMDGKRHRVPVEGGKKGTLDGFYVGHLDGHPAGRIINNKTGTDITWKSKGYALSDQEKAKLQAEAAEKLAQRAAEQDKLQEATAQRVGRQMPDLVPVEQPTPYLQAKGIEAHAGVFTDREGQKTYIPAFDVDGKQWTMQYIQEDGTKRFAKDSKKEGCFHPVGGMDALAAAPALVIAEGYATAASLAEGLGHATVAAFDSGNLPHVARALREKFPDKPIVIAGDDDKAQEIERGHNPGRAKAEEAAKAVGGKAIFPIFAPGEQQANPKGFTDFNDLANKSELGRDGLKRQVGAAVGQVLIEEGRRQQQEQRQERAEKQQQQPERPRRAARIG